MTRSGTTHKRRPRCEAGPSTKGQIGATDYLATIVAEMMPVSIDPST